MEKRPKIKLVMTPRDKFVEFLGALFLALCWSASICALAVLPDIVPVHFDLSGKPDGYGSPLAHLILPCVSTFMYALMTLINRAPHIFNYPVKITPENALANYTKAVRLIRNMKMSILFVFALIEICFVLSSAGICDSPGIWFIPLILIAVTAPLIIYLFKNKSI